MLKKINYLLTTQKKIKKVFNDLKKIKGNDNYLEYISNFRQHILNPNEDIENRMYDVVNYLRSSKNIIVDIGEKKIKNGSVILSDNSTISKEIFDKAKSKGKKFHVFDIHPKLIDKADIILVGNHIPSNILKLAKKNDVPVFFCINSLKKITKKKEINNFTGIISELGIYNPWVFIEETER